MLKWAGIPPDEGYGIAEPHVSPVKALSRCRPSELLTCCCAGQGSESSMGPYLQSQRLPMYQVRYCCAKQRVHCS